MRISDREIKNSLRLLSQPPIGAEGRVRLDPKVVRLILDQLREVPEIRMEMVLPLKEAIRECRYKVSSEEVARKMLGRCLADNLH